MTVLGGFRGMFFFVCGVGRDVDLFRFWLSGRQSLGFELSAWKS